MRDVVYFHGHGMTRALIVLGAYAVVGATVVLSVQAYRARTPRATAPA
jgi:hypothetical protein